MALFQRLMRGVRNLSRLKKLFPTKKALRKRFGLKQKKRVSQRKISHPRRRLKKIKFRRSQRIRRSNSKFKKVKNPPLNLRSKFRVKSFRTRRIKQPSRILQFPRKQGILSSEESLGLFAGEVTHFFEKIKVCVIKITHHQLKIGDRVRIIGRTTNFVQKVQSLQIESQDVTAAPPGSLAGLKIDQVAREGDKVFIRQ